MGTIVALGGGEIGRPGYPVETTKIDREIIRLSGKRHPKLLFLPTASNDSEGYVKVVHEHFGKRLGCQVSELLLHKKRYSQKQLKDSILKTDIIYVGGGNTKSMLKRWRQAGVDKLLKEAHRKGVILSGLSAGSVCWFRHGHSDCEKMVDPKADYNRLKCLGLVPALHCPHLHREPQRRPSLKRMMRTTPGVAIGLDDCVAIIIKDAEYRIMSSKPGRKAYRIQWQGNRYQEEIITQRATYRPLAPLLRKG